MLREISYLTYCFFKVNCARDSSRITKCHEFIYHVQWKSFDHRGCPGMSGFTSQKDPVYICKHFVSCFNKLKAFGF